MAAYENSVPAGWKEGDWNGDGVFDSGDLVWAFQDGGYERGPRPNIATVPEPSSLLLVIGALGVLLARHR